MRYAIKTIEILMASKILDLMPSKFEHSFDPLEFVSELANHGHDLEDLPGWTFNGLRIFADSHEVDNNMPAYQNDKVLEVQQACNIARFAGAVISPELSEGVTHVIIQEKSSQIKSFRQRISSFKRLPRLVRAAWVEDSWREQTLLDEERRSQYQD